MTIASLHTFVKAQSWGQKSWYICRYWGQTDMGKLNADFFQGGGFCVPRQVSQIYIYAYQTNIEKNWPGLVLNLKSKDPWFRLWATVQGHSSSLHCEYSSIHGKRILYIQEMRIIIILNRRQGTKICHGIYGAEGSEKKRSSKMRVAPWETCL